MFKRFCEWVRGSSKKKTIPADLKDWLESKKSLEGIADLIPTLGEKEVIIKKALDGNAYDVFCLHELTPDQLDLLARGESPDGLTVFTV